MNENTIEKLIDNAKLSIVSYIDADGFPVSRAMLAPRERDGLRTFWFSTNTSSNKVSAFRMNPRASIYFVDRRFYRGICLSGSMEVLETVEARKRIWRTGDEMYYHGGVTDADYCVLRFTAEHGRFYSNFQSTNFLISHG